LATSPSSFLGGTAVIVVISSVLVYYGMNILYSTKNILLGIMYSILTIVYLLIKPEQWYYIAMVVVAMASEYYKNKKNEQAILNTVQYMINNKNHKSISISEINENLNLDDMKVVSKTLGIYKKKAIIPYDINIIE